MDVSASEAELFSRAALGPASTFSEAIQASRQGLHGAGAPESEVTIEMEVGSGEARPLQRRTTRRSPATRKGEATICGDMILQ